MPIYTGVCSCGCRDFVQGLGEFECTECGEIYTTNPEDASDDYDGLDDLEDF